MTIPMTGRRRTPHHSDANDCGAAGWLGLAASPSFALMAWLAARDASPLCATHTGMLPLSHMAWMYLLMGLFHASPWLRLAAGRRQASTDPATQTEGD